MEIWLFAMHLCIPFPGINSPPCLLDAPARPLPAEPATDGSGPETTPLPSPVDDM